jgi:hypothetical protein
MYYQSLSGVSNAYFTTKFSDQTIDWTRIDKVQYVYLSNADYTDETWSDPSSLPGWQDVPTQFTYNANLNRLYIPDSFVNYSLASYVFFRVRYKNPTSDWVYGEY